MGVEVFQAIEVKEIHRRGRVISIPANDNVTGATAGWVKNNDTGTAKCPASQTGSTMTIPVSLEIGTTIKSFMVSGQLESAGNGVTLDADLRYTTAAAGALVDASLGAITQISKTADYLVADSKTLTTPHKTISGNHYYVLVTATTGAVTDLDLNALEICVDKM